MFASNMLGWDNPYPERRPYDKCGMKARRKIQYATMRKMRGHISNSVHTLPGGLDANFISSENNIGSISSSFTNTE